MSQVFKPAESSLPFGLSVIEASAGTGKTFSLSHLVPRLLLEGSVSRLGEILLVTFTNDAAAELADRIRRVMEKLASPPEDDEDSVLAALRNKFLSSKNPAGAQILDKALREMDQLSVSTIHSFCQRVLQLEGPLCGWPVSPELIPDAGEVLEEILYREWVEKLALDPLLATVAETDGWSLAKDAKFFLDFVEKDKLQPEPKPLPLKEALAQLSDLLQQLGTAEIDGFFKLVELGDSLKPTRYYPSEETLERIKTVLSETSPSPREQLQVARELANAGGWINKQSKAGKQRSQELTEHPLPECGESIITHLAKLRWSYLNDLLNRGQGLFNRHLRDHRLVTYEGLVSTIRDTLEGPRGGVLRDRLRKRYKVALIDESQDTDPRQYAIFAKIFLEREGETPSGSHRLVLIGDPKQAIYAFRGADVNTYLSAAGEAKEKFSLTTTYRAPEALVKCVNTIFKRDRSFLKEGLSFAEADSGLSGDLYLQDPAAPESRVRVQAWVVPDEEADAYKKAVDARTNIARQVAGEIQRLLSSKALLVAEGKGDSRAVEPGDFAVLVSSHYEGEMVAQALQSRGVPCLRARLGDVLSSTEAEEMIVLLRALLHPRRQSARIAALATRAIGFRAGDLQDLREHPEKEERWLERFTRSSVLWREKGVTAGLQRLFLEAGVFERLAGLPDGERGLVNWRQIFDLLQSASSHHEKPEALFRWIVAERKAVLEGRANQEREILLETDEEAVQIVTMHSAKGLEYPFVFCPFLWGSQAPPEAGCCSVRGPDTRSYLVELSLMPNSQFHEQLARESIEDRLRLIYVALTRARAKLWLFAGNLPRNQKKTPSALDWLLRPEPEKPFVDWWEDGVEKNPGEVHRKVLSDLIEANGAEEFFSINPPPNYEDPQNPRGKEIQDEREVAFLETSPRPVVPFPWGMTSFSSLTKEKAPHGLRGSEEESVDMEDSTNPFLLAPGGTRVGSAVHDWIETWDFTLPVISSELKKHLAKYPLFGCPTEVVEVFPSQVEGMLAQLSRAKLNPWDCTIAGACPRADLSEWDFQLPLRRALRPEALADLARRHGEEDYSPYLETLPLPELTGYLNGFIDRITYWEGQYGVIDWKTNNLGGSPSSYRGEALRAAVMESHYLLQSWLYLVALRRYLGPDKPIGGAWVVFLRGVAPESDHGVLSVLPQESLLEELEEFF